MGRARSGSAASEVTAPITLREFEDGDVDAATAWISDPAVTRFMTWDPGDRARAAAWLRQVAADAEALPRTSWELAVVEVETGLVVGAGRLTVRDAQHRCGDIGYVLRRDRWGRGLGSEVARQLVERGFERVGLHRIEATCDVENVASARVLEKAGLRLEGRLRERFQVRGEWRDLLLYAALARDDRLLSTDSVL
ncbi:MAG TPA: GNAT family protein [Candidatus Binatia bacterium]|jgi:RimJ/RimL family protein N-acetyltransferase|nr:GNAT family protein [Candidatus Binatia bacterium]